MIEQPCRDLGHFRDGLLESLGVCLRGLAEAADLAHVLQCRRADLVLIGRWIKVVESFDVSAHASILGVRRPTGSTSLREAALDRQPILLCRLLPRPLRSPLVEDLRLGDVLPMRAFCLGDAGLLFCTRPAGSHNRSAGRGRWSGRAIPGATARLGTRYRAVGSLRTDRIRLTGGGRSNRENRAAQD